MLITGLLHPDVSPQAIEPFRRACPDVALRENLEVSADLDAALIFGGDGTVHRHLPELHRHKIPVLIVPKGSGNDFAKALGIPNEGTALRAWREFCSTCKNVREIDLGVIRTGQAEILFACVAGVGLDSAANARANRMPSWLRGSAGYLLAALRILPTFQPVEMVSLSGEHEARGSAFFVAVANAHRYGGGMRVAPRAELDDGLLDVCRVERMNKWKLLCCVPTIFFGAHLGIKQVRYFQTRTIRIESARPLEVYADGEYACLAPVDIAVLPRALTVIVPVSSGARLKETKSI
jgi:diacylglycerol kinase (ATP)